MSFVFVPPKGSVLDLVVKNLTDAICYCYYILEVVPILSFFSCWSALALEFYRLFLSWGIQTIGGKRVH